MREHWMHKRPSSQLIEAWEHYIKDIVLGKRPAAFWESAIDFRPPSGRTR